MTGPIAADLTQPSPVSPERSVRGDRPTRIHRDQLIQLWQAQAPYVSAPVDLRSPRPERLARWEDRLIDLSGADAPRGAVAALAHELASESLPSSAGLLVLAAADGTNIVIETSDSPYCERIALEQLPRTAIALEWTQRVSSSVHPAVALDRLSRVRCRGESADGVIEVVDALVEGSVELLVVRADPNDRRMAWFGPRPTELAIDLEHADHDSTQMLDRAPLTEVLIRSAIMQGAAAAVVPHRDERLDSAGVGAVLLGARSD